MILITGGLGFIGSHTTRALVDAGEECVVLQRSHSDLPEGRFAPDMPILVEQCDIGDLGGLLALGRRYEIDGIVHLAGSEPWPADTAAPIEQTRRVLDGLLNVFELARTSGVRRVGVAGTMGVYFGTDGPIADGPLDEEMTLSIASGPFPIPNFKKIGEMLGGHFESVTGIEVVNFRISGTWGPLGRAHPFFAAPELVHAAAEDRRPDFSRFGRPVHAEEAMDLCYVKDTGRAIALLQSADELGHRTYNVASGRATTNSELIAAIRRVVPDADIDLPAGDPEPRSWLDISRLREDTGHEPAWDVEAAGADYIDWLRSGNEW